MKIIGLTQRVDFIPTYEERRDALDQRWISLCRQCDLLPIPLPNHLPTVWALIEQISFDGFIFTGGNSLQIYGGNAPERDQVEKALLEHVIQKRLPLLGVCRGMQMIQHFFGVSLREISGHTRQEHSILFENGRRVVNSYHDYGTCDTLPSISAIARAEDGVIEAIQHEVYPIRGIMWHPERNERLSQEDQKLFKEVFG